MISVVMNIHYFAICNLIITMVGHMRACLSYQCCSKTDLLVIIIIFVSVKLTSQKILEGEKRANLLLKKKVKLTENWTQQKSSVATQTQLEPQ